MTDSSHRWGLATRALCRWVCSALGLLQLESELVERELHRRALSMPFGCVHSLVGYEIQSVQYFNTFVAFADHHFPSECIVTSRSVALLIGYKIYSRKACLRPYAKR